ncbi:hypothetical protein N7447_006241 [Penicillium robsamsonii]|uniref:uncharacterized protein n=1 Tax=Penicillium robsamsonii TaxID=1792511 RepID=UPI0025467CF5|nr:uncharacterized protein N7447_006241 [Penicillium robsamsonii]KAJ5823901.1 hypothetical protein N7447_006241 [Penicillium robsamsonii]
MICQDPGDIAAIRAEVELRYSETLSTIEITIRESMSETVTKERLTALGTFREKKVLIFLQTNRSYLNS